MLLLALMVLGAITGVPTPACLSAASNPVEAVTPPYGAGNYKCWALKELSIAGAEASGIDRNVRLFSV
jgi:hypothetical protein